MVWRRREPFVDRKGAWMEVSEWIGRGKSRAWAGNSPDIHENAIHRLLSPEQVNESRYSHCKVFKQAMVWVSCDEI